MKKEDFEITKLDDSPCKHVEAFFGTNVSYFDCTGVPPHGRFDVFEVDAITSMVSDSSSRAADDRRIAVEMQMASALPFTNEYIHAIVGPTAMMATPWFADFLAGPGTGIKCVTYAWNLRHARVAMLREFHGTVADVSVTSTGFWCRHAAVTAVCGFVNYWARFTQFLGGLGATHPEIECRRSRYLRQVSQTVQTLQASRETQPVRRCRGQP
jgi:hypothetical protein